jgi:hypothetical protein
MMSRTRASVLIAASTIALTAWRVTREPTRIGYLANVARHVHHLPGRYAT